MGQSPSSAYRLVSEEPIGRGAFGEVYLVKDKEGRQFALKKIRVSGRAAKRAAIREAQMLAGLKHANVIRGLAFWEDAKWVPFRDKTIGIVVEFCNGGSLDRQLSRTSPMDEKHLLDIAFQAANGLCYLHEKGIIHRDIKMENILVTSSGDGTVTFKLADLGLAALVSPDAQEPTGKVRLCGTKPYLAPEVLEHRSYSFASDVYALGCVLAELMLGARCWKFRDLATAVGKCDGYTRQLRDLVITMLERNPLHRPSAPDVRFNLMEQRKTLGTRALMARWRTNDMLLALSAGLALTVLTALIALLVGAFSEVQSEPAIDVVD